MTLSCQGTSYPADWTEPSQPKSTDSKMTQFFRSASNPAGLPAEKRGVNSFPVQGAKQAHGSNRDFPRKVKNFFRITSLSSSSSGNNSSGGASGHAGDSTTPPKQETKSFRQSRFLPSLGRHRSTTVVSEGNPLDETLSPTALANPYFAHQGPPALRHHNEGSVPPSPPDTPRTQKGDSEDGKLSAKEEVARKLRRVASAPNAQGLFANGEAAERPATAGAGKEGFEADAKKSPLSTQEQSSEQLLPVPAVKDALSPPGIPRHSLAFRRTYSSNSIKVRNVEVGPGSFDKIKLIGKGDVGKVYLVREKKSGRLYAMKGAHRVGLPSTGSSANAGTQC